MIDECRVVERVHEARLDRPHAEVGLFAVAETERGLVEGARGVEGPALDVQADADSRGEARILRNGAALHETSEGLDVVTRRDGVDGEEARDRADGGVVGEGGDGGDIRRGVGGRLKLLEPARGDDGVAVEEHDVPPRCRHASIDTGHEASPLRIFHDVQPVAHLSGHRLERLPCLELARTVEDHDEPMPREVGCRGEAGQAAEEVRRSAVHGHDHVDGARRGLQARVAVASVRKRPGPESQAREERGDV